MQHIILQTEDFVRITLGNAEGGHDWFHTDRVRKLALRIAKEEEIDTFVVELGALLHDIADSKFYNGDEKVGPQKAFEFLSEIGVDGTVIDHVVNIIKYVSFGGGNHSVAFSSPELEVIQDADRLDAIGAIGIARTFNYGGFKDRAMYDPSVAPNLKMTKEEYRKSTAPTINHFYEKLLLLKDRMHTAAGRQIAEQRHAFMLGFLDEFYAEWKGER